LVIIMPIQSDAVDALGNIPNALWHRVKAEEHNPRAAGCFREDQQWHARPAQDISLFRAKDAAHRRGTLEARRTSGTREYRADTTARFSE
jgi:hypothetical protein